MSTTKLGRNSTCNCKSGKKYKKCCLPKEEEEARLKLEKERAENKAKLEEAFKLARESGKPVPSRVSAAMLAALAISANVR